MVRNENCSHFWNHNNILNQTSWYIKTSWKQIWLIKIPLKVRHRHRMKVARTKIRNPEYRRNEQKEKNISTNNIRIWIETAKSNDKFYQEYWCHSSSYQLLSKTAASPRGGRFIAAKNMILLSNLMCSIEGMRKCNFPLIQSFTHRKKKDNAKTLSNIMISLSDSYNIFVKTSNFHHSKSVHTFSAKCS